MKQNSSIDYELDGWKRLDAVIKWSSLSVHAFAKRIGVLRAENLYNIKRGNYGISHNLADRIVAEYPEIDRTWLLSGVGSMLKDSLTQERLLPFYNHDAESVIAHIEDVAPSCKVNMPYMSECDFVIRSFSRSMAEPQCAASDLFVRRVSPDSVTSGNEYIIVLGNQTIWRKVRFTPNEKQWKLVSRNREEFPDTIIDKGMVVDAWHVVARLAVITN